MRTVVVLQFEGEKILRRIVLPGTPPVEGIADHVFEQIAKGKKWFTHTVRIVTTGPTAGEVEIVHQGKKVAKGRVRHEQSDPD